MLYDFAQDGFANHRDEVVLQELVKKGVLLYANGSLMMMNESFRIFVLSKSGTSEWVEIEHSVGKSEKWDLFKVSVFIVVIAVALFVFFTQEEAFQKISAVLASMVASVSMLLRFMDQGKNGSKSKLAS